MKFYVTLLLVLALAGIAVGDVIIPQRTLTIEIDVSLNRATVQRPYLPQYHRLAHLTPETADTVVLITFYPGHCDTTVYVRQSDDDSTIGYLLPYMRLRMIGSVCPFKKDSPFWQPPDTLEIIIRDTVGFWVDTTYSECEEFWHYDWNHCWRDTTKPPDRIVDSVVCDTTLDTHFVFEWRR